MFESPNTKCEHYVDGCFHLEREGEHCRCTPRLCPVLMELGFENPEHKQIILGEIEPEYNSEGDRSHFVVELFALNGGSLSKRYEREEYPNIQSILSKLSEDGWRPYAVSYDDRFRMGMKVPHLDEIEKVYHIMKEV